MNIPLVSNQVTCIQDNIYKTLKISKPLPPLTLLEHMAYAIKPPFNDPPRPKMVDYSLTTPP